MESIGPDLMTMVVVVDDTEWSLIERMKEMAAQGLKQRNKKNMYCRRSKAQPAILQKSRNKKVDFFCTI